jgi:hypothetical protein
VCANAVKRTDASVIRLKYARAIVEDFEAVQAIVLEADLCSGSVR